MTGPQKNNLKRKLQERKKVVQSQLRDVNAAIKHVARHAKAKSARRGRR